MILTKESIVGQGVVRLLQSPWERIEGIEVCSVYVVLSNGEAFEIDYYEPEDGGIPNKEIVDCELVDAELPMGMVSCLGETIEEVAYCDHWPTIGLRLSSGRFLVSRDRGIPYTVGAYIYSPDESELIEVIDFYGDEAEEGGLKTGQS